MTRRLSMKPPVILFALVCATLAGCGGDDVNDAVFKGLRADLEKCRRDMAAYRDSGLVAKSSTANGRTDLVIDERRWDALDGDAKKSVALAAYCVDAGADGRHRVAIAGSRHGEPKGSVTNGNWASK